MNIQNTYGETPLSYSARDGHVAVVVVVEAQHVAVIDSMAYQIFDYSYDMLL